jgi:RNA polymerase sigma factor (TIGR02999 family)
MVVLPPVAGTKLPLVEQEFSRLFSSAAGGDSAASEALFAALYAELHRLASRQLARSARSITLGTTTLLHEAYLDINRREGLAFPDRERFMAYASRVMRGLLIDYVRNRKAQKRGGLFEIVSLPDQVEGAPEDAEHVARIGEAVEKLALLDPALAQVVDLKFFCGFTFNEIAAMQHVSVRTVRRHWNKARMLLHGLIAD